MIKISVSEGESYVILNHRGLGFLLGSDGRCQQKDLILCKEVGGRYFPDIKVVHGKARKHLVLGLAVRRVIIEKLCVK